MQPGPARAHRDVARGRRPAGVLGVVRAIVFVVSLGPLLRLVVLGAGDGLGANPVEFVTRSLGTWTLVFLCLGLAISPLRWLGAPAAIVRLRRMLGLYAFFYASLHFLMYLWLDQWFDWRAIVADIVERPFIAAGFVAWLLMIPLALTSNRFAMRRLGSRWQLLHRLVYLLVPAGVLHFWWHKAGKNDIGEPAIYALIVALLLLARVVRRARRVGPPDQAGPASRVRSSA
ncbi:MAG: protein-methionine-sulfoxide reductase heme-binding subunit MsrQ [Burkholderiaceae bacterium]